MSEDQNFSSAKAFIEMDSAIIAIQSQRMFAALRIFGYRAALKNGVIKTIPKWERIARLCESKDRRKVKRGRRLAYEAPTPTGIPWGISSPDAFNHGGVMFSPYKGVD